jgi:hypothetical protein
METESSKELLVVAKVTGLNKNIFVVKKDQKEQ